MGDVSTLGLAEVEAGAAVGPPLDAGAVVLPHALEASVSRRVEKTAPEIRRKVR